MSKSSSPGLTHRGKNEPRSVVLRVKVAAETRRAAARLARDYARRDLEIVLAAFVGDLAVAAARPGSWEHKRVCAWLGSHVWQCEPHEL
ncbi:MAG: hypothetical protein ACREIA_25690 [Opitutaceae bacterium]